MHTVSTRVVVLIAGACPHWFTSFVAMHASIPSLQRLGLGLLTLRIAVSGKEVAYVRAFCVGATGRRKNEDENNSLKCRHAIDPGAKIYPIFIVLGRTVSGPKVRIAAYENGDEGIELEEGAGRTARDLVLF